MEYSVLRLYLVLVVGTEYSLGHRILGAVEALTRPRRVPPQTEMTCPRIHLWRGILDDSMGLADGTRSRRARWMAGPNPPKRPL